MKSVVVGWMFGLGLMLSHVGCCSVRMMGDGCGAGTCGGGCSDGCDTLSFGDHMAPFAGIGHRMANRIRSTNCNSGCGEIYWDEQINEPPVCDPCGCNGEFTGDSCGSCPTALRRLRNMWNFNRYQSSNCGSCSSCGGDAGFLGASTCSSCSSGSGENYSMHTNSDSIQSIQTQPTQRQSMKSNQSRRAFAPQDDSGRTQPTPAIRPLREAPPELRSTPTPVPDPNAMIRYPSQNGLTIGSGTTNKETTVTSQQMVKAKSVSSKPTQSVQGRPRLVTNPR